MTPVLSTLIQPWCTVGAISLSLVIGRCSPNVYRIIINVVYGVAIQFARGKLMFSFSLNSLVLCYKKDWF